MCDRPERLQLSAFQQPWMPGEQHIPPQPDPNLDPHRLPPAPTHGRTHSPPPPHHLASDGADDHPFQATTAVNVTDCGDDPGHSPPRMHTPDSSNSGDSINAGRRHVMTPESESRGSPSPPTGVPQMDRLSLVASQHHTLAPNAPLHSPFVPESSTTHDVAHDELRQSNNRNPPSSHREGSDSRRSRTTRSKSKHWERKNRPFKTHAHYSARLHGNRRVTTFKQRLRESRPPRDSRALCKGTRDSNYDLAPSRHITAPSYPARSLSPEISPSSTRVEHDMHLPDGNQHDEEKDPPSEDPYYNIKRQPDSSPISQDQLAAEVKGIYAGLVMVEAKCINIDAAQAADSSCSLTSEQWQALIALHKTLLYEHHDFLMATQHPSATQPLQHLARKYNMPARMWRHGIHAFLEVLRLRRPESQDYMLHFINIAYQMMALLFETVPSFVDVWIECLGDLARYRMAVEEDKEIHAQWSTVAGRWYTMASDRRPADGRLYHHLGILETPSLRKLCFYMKALTSCRPFGNARDSFKTLCAPILRDQKAVENSAQSAEARIVTLHALMFCEPDRDGLHEIAIDAVRLWHYLSPVRKQHLGGPLAVTNIAALVSLPNRFSEAVSPCAARQASQESQENVSEKAAPAAPEVDMLSSPQPQADHLRAENDLNFALRRNFCFACFNTVLESSHTRKTVYGTLPFVHIMLSFIYGRAISPVGLLDSDATVMTNTLSFLSPDVVYWNGLPAYLNSLAYLERPISAKLLERARQGAFPLRKRNDGAQRLPEDFLIRGLVWSQGYFAPDWFDEHMDLDGRSIETSKTTVTRVERVQLLGMTLGSLTEHLRFDAQRKYFWAPVKEKPTLFGQELERALQRPPPEPSFYEPKEARAAPESARTSTTFNHAAAGRCNERPPRRAWAGQVPNQPPPPPTKSIQKYEEVKVVDEDSVMQWEMEA